MAEKPKLLVLEPFRSQKALERLKSKFDVRVLRDLSELEPRPAAIEGLFVRLKYKIDGPLLDRLPGLKFVATPATGLVHLDLDALAARGIAVVSLKDETAFLRDLTATAELAWGLILAFHRNLGPAMRGVKDGVWDRDPFIGSELREKTIGIVGLGRLGTMVAEYAKAFRMKVLYNDPREAGLEWARRVSQDELLAESDVITLHLHVSEKTRGMLSRAEFARMERKPLLVNTSRGELIDEAALLEALRSGRLRGAALDVLCGEHWNTPTDQKAWMEANPLVAYARENDNLLLTPHIGGLVHEGVERAELFTVEKLL